MNKGEYTIIASDEKERNDWLTSLQAVVQRAKFAVSIFFKDYR